jgi:ATP phosphoribosyltransferase regulatory subunit HisZ
VFELLPPEVAKWQYVEEKARAVLDAFGYREVRTAVVAGDGALRPPGTAALARSYVARALWLRESPTRWYELGPVFRRSGTKVQQSSQLAGVVFGAAGAAVEAETIAMVVGLVGEAGVPVAAITTSLLGDADRAQQERVRGLLEAVQMHADYQPASGAADITFVIAAEDVPLVQGGRIDGVGPHGGPALPAFAFIMDMAALVQAVPDPAESFLAPPAALLVADGPRAADWALATAHRLRLAGVRIEIGARSGSGRSRLLVTARDEDLGRGRVFIEDLATGGRQEILEDELEAIIRMRLD